MGLILDGLSQVDVERASRKSCSCEGSGARRVVVIVDDGAKSARWAARAIRTIESVAVLYHDGKTILEGVLGPSTSTQPRRRSPSGVRPRAPDLQGAGARRFWLFAQNAQSALSASGAASPCCEQARLRRRRGEYGWSRAARGTIRNDWYASTDGVRAGMRHFWSVQIGAAPRAPGRRRSADHWTIAQSNIDRLRLAAHC